MIPVLLLSNIEYEMNGGGFFLFVGWLVFVIFPGKGKISE